MSAQAVFQISVDNEVQGFLHSLLFLFLFTGYLELQLEKQATIQLWVLPFINLSFIPRAKPSNSSPEAVKPADTRFALALRTGGITVILEHDGTGK